MAIRDVVTRGYGNGVFNGTITDVVLRGYDIGEEAETPQSQRFDLIGPTLKRFSINGPTKKRHSITGPHES